MRVCLRLLVALGCIVALRSGALAGSIGAGQSFPPRCATTQQQIPTSDPYGLSYGYGSAATQGPSATAGRLYCIRATIPCQGGSYTKLALKVITGTTPTDSQSAIAIYSSDGSAKVADSALQINTQTAGTKIATGLTPFALTAGQSYLVCVASSATGTLEYHAMRGPDEYIAGLAANLWTYIGGTGTSDVAQFNLACTGASAPYACCTGSGTGTCTGMPATVTPTASSSFRGIPVLVGE